MLKAKTTKTNASTVPSIASLEAQSEPVVRGAHQERHWPNDKHKHNLPGRQISTHRIGEVADHERRITDLITSSNRPVLFSDNSKLDLKADSFGSHLGDNVEGYLVYRG